MHSWGDLLRAVVTGVIASRYFIAACFALFLLLRLALILLIPVTQESDAAQYFRLAQSIGAGAGYTEHGMPTAYWPVGYPGFLGGLFAVFGSHPVVGQLANLTLAAASFFLVLGLTRRIFQSETTARVAVLLLALYPNHIAYTPLLLTELLFTLLVLAGCWLAMFHGGRRAAIVAGLIFGLATLVKPQTLLLPAMLILLGLMSRSGRLEVHRRLRNGLLLYLALMAVLVPWSARNFLVLGSPILVSTNGGVNLLIGNNPSADGGYLEDDALLAQRRFSLADQVAADQRAKALATQWIAAHPRRFLELMPLKALRLWGWDGEADWSYRIGFANYHAFANVFRGVRAANQVYYFGLLALFLASIAMLPGRLARLTVPWIFFGYAFVLYTTLISLIVFGAPRFHFPLMPWIIMYASWVVSEWLLHRVDAPSVTTPLSDHARRDATGAVQVPRAVDHQGLDHA